MTNTEKMEEARRLSDGRIETLAESYLAQDEHHNIEAPSWSDIHNFARAIEAEVLSAAPAAPVVPCDALAVLAKYDMAINATHLVPPAFCWQEHKKAEAIRLELVALLAASPVPQAPAEPVVAAVQAEPLAVWYGSMPESNGRTNWTAILYRGDLSEGFTIARSEYPHRVRYEADCVRFLIGELTAAPHILDYDDSERTPCHLCGGSGLKEGEFCWGLNFDGTTHAAPIAQPAAPTAFNRNYAVGHRPISP